MASQRFIASLLAFCALGASSVMAQGSYTPGIDRAQQTISARIEQGQASGRITPSEAQQLLRREHDIQMRENRYKANGNVTPQERQQLRAELDALSAEVDHMMSNRDVARQQGHAGMGIDQSQFQISQRIEEGIRSGRLSEREVRRLRAQEREIERHEAYFKSDRVVTVQEQRELHRELMALRDEVERLMRSGPHDRRGRG